MSNKSSDGFFGRDDVKRILSIIAFLSSISIPPAIIPFLSDQDTLQVILDFIQLATIVAIVFYTFAFQVAHNNELPTASSAVEQFTTYWTRLWWSSWMLLYLFFSIRGLVDTISRPAWMSPAEPYLTIIANTFNNMQAVCTYILFVVMFKDTVRHNKLSRQFGLCVFVVFLMMIAELVAEALLPQLDLPFDTHFTQKLAGMIAGTLSGVLCAISLSMFVGRLESRYLRLSTLTIAALYTYAAIQPLFPMFRIGQALSGPKIVLDHKSAIVIIQNVLKVVGLVLKSFMFIVVTRLLKDGRMLFFMERAREINEKIDDDWNKFRTRYVSNR